MGYPTFSHLMEGFQVEKQTNNQEWDLRLNYQGESTKLSCGFPLLHHCHLSTRARNWCQTSTTDTAAWTDCSAASCREGPASSSGTDLGSSIEDDKRRNQIKVSVQNRSNWSSQGDSNGLRASPTNFSSLWRRWSNDWCSMFVCLNSASNRSLWHPAVPFHWPGGRTVTSDDRSESSRAPGGALWGCHTANHTIAQMLSSRQYKYRPIGRDRT